MNLNKAIVYELYHFKTPEDITHLIANCCIMMVCDCRKGYWHQELDKTSSFLTTFNTELGRFQNTVMPFGLTVTALLEITRKCNVQLHYDKLQYKKTEVNFFRETYTTNGHRPAQTKVSTTISMPEPDCKKEVQSFIGMINYLSKFFTRLSDLSECIREQFKEKVPFNWGLEH